MIKFVSMIIVGIISLIYGLILLNNLKDDDKDKDLKRFGYSILITFGIILVGNGIYQIVIYNRLNPIRRIPSLPDLPRFSPFSSPRRATNV